MIAYDHEISMAILDLVDPYFSIIYQILKVFYNNIFFKFNIYFTYSDTIVSSDSIKALESMETLSLGAHTGSCL